MWEIMHSLYIMRLTQPTQRKQPLKCKNQKEEDRAGRLWVSES